MRQREILKFIENLSSKIDYLSVQAPNTVTLEVNETYPENLIPTARPIEVNELLRDESQHSFIVLIISAEQGWQLLTA